MCLFFPPNKSRAGLKCNRHTCLICEGKHASSLRVDCTSSSSGRPPLMPHLNKTLLSWLGPLSSPVLDSDVRNINKEWKRVCEREGESITGRILEPCAPIANCHFAYRPRSSLFLLILHLLIILFFLIHLFTFITHLFLVKSTHFTYFKGGNHTFLLFFPPKIALLF